LTRKSRKGERVIMFFSSFFSLYFFWLFTWIEVCCNHIHIQKRKKMATSLPCLSQTREREYIINRFQLNCFKNEFKFFFFYIFLGSHRIEYWWCYSVSWSIQLEIWCKLKELFFLGIFFLFWLGYYQWLLQWNRSEAKT
jgi:hypothetical protein